MPYTDPLPWMFADETAFPGAGFRFDSQSKETVSCADLCATDRPVQESTTIPGAILEDRVSR